MRAKDIIEQLMIEKEFTQERLAHACGYAKPQNISNHLLRGDTIKVDVLNRLAGPLGCEVVLRDKETGREWVIDK